MKKISVYLMIFMVSCFGFYKWGQAGEGVMNNTELTQNLEKATFAGGCFWCMEKPFEQYEGVIQVVSGYTGGRQNNPSYQEVSSGSTGHLEAVEVTYKPKEISYDKLLEIFWQHIDPTDPGGQFADRGEQYTTAIFYHDNQQKQLAEDSRDNLDRSGKFESPIAVKILKASIFFPAEEYHQDYYKKQPVHYNNYYQGSGRGSYLKRVWEKE